METSELDAYTIDRRRRLSLASASLREKYNIIKEEKLREEARRKELEEEHIRTLRKYQSDIVDTIVDTIIFALGRCIKKSESCALHVVVHASKGYDAEYTRLIWKIVTDDLLMSSYYVSAVNLLEVKYPLMRFSELTAEPPGSSPQGEVKHCLKVSLEK
jgi:hypothetical protein